MKTRLHLHISGIVQGVFFRDSTREVAQARGLTGYVTNLPDGRVQVVAEGEKTDIDSLVQWCHAGPPRAVVKSVEIHIESYKGEFMIFEVRR